MDNTQRNEIIEKIEAYLETKKVSVADKYDIYLVLHERARQDKLDELEYEEGDEEIVEEEIDLEEEKPEMAIEEEEPAEEEGGELGVEEDDGIEGELAQELSKEKAKPITKQLNKPIKIMKRPKIPLKH